MGSRAEIADKISASELNTGKYKVSIGYVAINVSTGKMEYDAVFPIDADGPDVAEVVAVAMQGLADSHKGIYSFGVTSIVVIEERYIQKSKKLTYHQISRKNFSGSKIKLYHFSK